MAYRWPTCIITEEFILNKYLQFLDNESVAIFTREVAFAKYIAISKLIQMDA